MCWFKRREMWLSIKKIDDRIWCMKSNRTDGVRFFNELVDYLDERLRLAKEDILKELKDTRPAPERGGEETQ